MITGLEYRQASSEPCCYNSCCLQFSIVLLKYSRSSLKKIRMGAYFTLRPNYTFQCCWHFPDVQAVSATGINAPLSHQKCRLFNSRMKTSLFTFFSLEDPGSCFPKRISAIDSFYLRTIFYFVSGHFQPFPSHTESPLESLNLLMMLGTIHDKIFKSLQFYMEKQNSDIVPQCVDIVFADK